MRKRLQIFFLLLLPCLALAGVLGRGSPPALTAASDAAIPVSADNWGPRTSVTDQNAERHANPKLPLS